MASWALNEESAAFVGGRIDTTGKFIGHLTNCYQIKSRGGAEGIHFEAVTNMGQSVDFDIYTVSKEGTPISRGESVMHSLMAVLGLKGLREKTDHTAETYDYDLRKRVTKKVVGFPQAIRKPIGFCIQQEWNNYDAKDGTKKCNMRANFVSWFDAETGQIAKEKIANEPATLADHWAKNAPSVKGVNETLASTAKQSTSTGWNDFADDEEVEHVTKQAQAQPNAPIAASHVEAVWKFEDDDIPF